MRHRIWAAVAIERQDHVGLRVPNVLKADPGYRIARFGAIFKHMLIWRVLLCAIPTPTRRTSTEYALGVSIDHSAEFPTPKLHSDIK